MKYVILGGVAAGTKAAAKLKRLDRKAEVKIFTKSRDISYAGCGLPYYIGGDIPTREELIVNSPEKYAGMTGAQVEKKRKWTCLRSRFRKRFPGRMKRRYTKKL